jgi:hypothetical protein
MGNLNTTQLAQTLLGPATRLYHQDLTTHANQPRMKIDKLGAGDFVKTDDPIGSNPTAQFNYENVGLHIEFVRPQNTNAAMGVFAAIKLQNLAIPIPTRFVLTATFKNPKQVLLNPQSVKGTFAASLLFKVGSTLMGATSQFRITGQRMNLPGTNVMPNRPDIAVNLYNKVIDPQNPSPFTLVLLVERASNTSTGEGRLYVEDQMADSFPFSFQNGLTAASIIKDFRVGLGTASGSDYSVALDVLEYEVWAPTRNH